MRYFILLFLSVAGISLQAQSPISITHNFPQEMKAGQTYNVDITIEKDGLLTYGAYTQKFPKGWKVVNEDNAENNAQFKFENNELKYSWIRLPQEQKIHIKYKLTPAESCSNETFTSTGVFSYIIGTRNGWITCKMQCSADSNSTKKETKTTVPSNGKTETSTPTVTETTTESTTPETNFNMDFSRTITKTETPGEFSVSIKITTDEVCTLKIIENLPSGFTFAGCDTPSAEAEDKTTLATFFWRQIPSTEFTLNYRIKSGSSAEIPKEKGQAIAIYKTKIIKKDIL